MITSIFYVAIGGALGSVLRFLISYFFNYSEKTSFPVSTFIVNVLGCFLIGILIALFEKQILVNPMHKLLLITGFCGGFTTFSTFAYESMILFHQSHFWTWGLYMMASNLLGFMMVMLGIYLLK
ncbi:MAG: putative fluoride ion transporter CrcB [Bacteroidia bacterium]|nr:MAG: putative fluoride ion transporter CrcB [Bacteroidia bacterium]